MKRTHLVPVDLVLVAMALAFVVLAAPAAAAPPCLGIGEYYTFAQDCAQRGAQDGWLPQLLLLAALAGSTLGLMTLRRELLRLSRR